MGDLTPLDAAMLAIVLLAGPVKDLVVHHRWIMYSLFIGLTLGGVPLAWLLARKRFRGRSVLLAVLALLISSKRAEIGMQTEEDLETLELLGELREIRLAHAKLLERMARVEKRLRMQTSGA